ncbi:DUF4365 domain-containing protein [Micromonospora sp. PLK6-60]|uniref:DUF4365 domain-containing protein n=1 Tax=Micromonospora sp. PLK6-60 TaxID=2873383 RepID=UPI001CA764DB|nr:DUF4365 domain-containing protein [Micromonospora sp. PLK6-60]MBY8873732.1 DUF4365 domain-containing protein [Micromonospora sp. PLK6-60]
MSVAEGAPGEAVVPARSVGRLPLNACKARYGVAYVRTVCSQAGVGFSETSPDEDYLAVDGLVSLPVAPVSVQIKCSSQFKIAGRSATWPAEVEWREKWQESLLPVYFVLVVLDVDDRADWLYHDETGTMHRAAGFWTRVDQQAGPGNINVPKTQRLTSETLDLWAKDVFGCFAPVEGVR